MFSIFFLLPWFSLMLVLPATIRSVGSTDSVLPVDLDDPIGSINRYCCCCWFSFDVDDSSTKLFDADFFRSPRSEQIFPMATSYDKEDVTVSVCVGCCPRIFLFSLKVKANSYWYFHLLDVSLNLYLH